MQAAIEMTDTSTSGSDDGSATAPVAAPIASAATASSSAAEVAHAAGLTTEQAVAIDMITLSSRDVAKLRLERRIKQTFIVIALSVRLRPHHRHSTCSNAPCSSWLTFIYAFSLLSVSLNQSPIFLLPVLSDDPMAMFTTVCLPLVGSFVGLFLVTASCTLLHRAVRVYCCGAARFADEEVTSATLGERRSVELLKGLPTRVLVEGDPELAATDEDGAECPLCLGNFLLHDELRVLPCRHGFHKHCIDRWLIVSQEYQQRECPMCKADPLALVLLASKGSSSSRREKSSSSRRHRDSGDDSGAGLQLGSLPPAPPAAVVVTIAAPTDMDS